MKDKKRLQLGVKSGVLFVVVLAILLACNLLIEKLNVTWDLTQEGIYTISDQTKSILQGIDREVTLYIISSEENFPIGFKQIIHQYEKESSNLKVVYRDMSLYPNFASQYMDSSTATVTENSIIVVSGEKHVYLDSEEYVTTAISDDYTGYTSALAFEPLLTSAINTVNDGETRKLYYITGHNELDMLSSTQTGLIRDNYTYEELNLINSEIPEDADIILINAPTTDYSKADCEKLRNYLNQGGHIYYIVEATVELENLTALMAEYGIQIEPGVVLEQNSAYIYGDTPTYILPVIEDTEITEDIYQAKLPLLILVSKGLTEISGTGSTLTGLIGTTSYAYSKVNLDSDYVSREDDDIVGPFYLAMLSEQEDGGSLLVLGSSNVLNDDANEVVSGTNLNFFLNGVNYLMGDEDKISIRTKAIRDDYNIYSRSQIYIFGGIAIAGIPIILIMIGAVVVIIRKKNSQNYGKKKGAKEASEEEADEDEPEVGDDESDSTEDKDESESESISSEDENLAEDESDSAENEDDPEAEGDSIEEKYESEE